MDAGAQDKVLEMEESARMTGSTAWEECWENDWFALLEVGMCTKMTGYQVILDLWERWECREL